MKRSVFSLIVGVFAAVAPSLAAERIKLAVDDAYATGVLTSLASNGGHDLLIAGYALHRVSINQAYDNTEVAIRDIASKLGARLQIVDGAMVLHPPCQPIRQPTTQPTLASERLSLSFNRIDPANLVQVIGDFHNLSVQASRPQQRARSRAVGIHVKSRETTSVLKLLSAATGVGLSETGNGQASLADPEPDVSCGAATSPQVELVALEEKRLSVSTQPCPRRYWEIWAKVPERRAQCLPLEYFELDALIPRGFIAVAHRYIAYLESPDGTTLELREGDFVGDRLGVVKSIDDRGATVEEIKRDLAGIYYYESVLIEHSGARKVLATRENR